MRKLEIECMLLFLALVAVPAHQLNQGQTLTNFLKARRSQYTAEDTEWTPSASTVDIRENETVHYVQSQKGMRERDLIKSLPGQPADVSFRQYSGYVTVDPSRGRALFYWFVEATRNPSQKPLVLWLNGGPGCSSMIGALLELGPFRVNPDGKTLYTNPYAWNKVANVLFLETPAGVGFSYSNTTADYNRTGDRLTSQDSFTFLLNWFGRFPEYKSRPFYITGESYAGYYIPELADQILTHKRLAQASGINLKGVMIGNGIMNSMTDDKGYYDYLWTHALNSDQTHEGIVKYCNFSPSASSSKLCFEFSRRSNQEEGNIDNYNIYAPLCHDNNSSASQSSQSRGGVYSYDPCSENYLYNYLNLPEVQRALHANVTNLKYAWDECSDVLLNWNDNPSSILPIIRRMIAARLRILIYSGDVDSVVPVTGTRYGINALHLPIEMPWRPWTSAEEVAGYTVTYKGLTFATVRGAGHEVPSYQPERSLTMTKYFLLGKPLPASSTA